jgi:hypothetical protein
VVVQSETGSYLSQHRPCSADRPVRETQREFDGENVWVEDRVVWFLIGEYICRRPPGLLLPDQFVVFPLKFRNNLSPLNLAMRDPENNHERWAWAGR